MKTEAALGSTETGDIQTNWSQTRGDRMARRDERYGHVMAAESSEAVGIQTHSATDSGQFVLISCGNSFHFCFERALLHAHLWKVKL